MVSCREQIINIEKLQKKKDELKQIESVLHKPILTDKTLIPLVEELVNEICEHEEVDTVRYSPKHYFLIIIALLYSPRVFGGEFMHRGYRDEIAESLGLSSSHISNSIRTVCAWSRYYEGFQKSLDYLYNEVLKQLEEIEA